MPNPERILLVDPSNENLGRVPGRGKQAPLLGLTCVATWAEAAGYDVRTWDCAVRPDGLLDMAVEFDPLLVGLTSTTPFFHSTQRAAGELRRRLPDAYMVLGGAQATAAARACLDACPELDAVAVGEGEETLVDLAAALQRGERHPSIPGLMTRTAPDDFTPRPLIPDLDRLPFPNWSLFDYADYAPVASRRLDGPAPLYQIQASRGCPGRCSFCFHVFGSTWRIKSPGRVAAEIFHTAERYGARHFEFVDPVMPHGRRWFSELCLALKTGPTHGRIAWGFQTRTDGAFEGMFQAAADAGCERVLFGLETGSEAMLDRMGKGTGMAHSWAAVEAAAAAGLKVHATLIVGHPGESRETMDLTREMVRAMRAAFDVEFFPAFLALYPGTAVYEWMESRASDAHWLHDRTPDWREARRDHPALEGGGLSARETSEFMRDLQAILQEPRNPEPGARLTVRP